MSATVNFAVPLDEFIKELNISMATATRLIALDIMTRIVKRTPVDTGRARSGWDLTIGTPSAFVPPEPAGATKEDKATPGRRFKSVFSGGEAIPVPLAAAAIDGTQQVFIINNLPYIEFLELGSSSQAPAGFVRISMAEVEATIEIMLAKLKKQ